MQRETYLLQSEEEHRGNRAPERDEFSVPASLLCQGQFEKWATDTSTEIRTFDLVFSETLKIHISTNLVNMPRWFLLFSQRLLLLLLLSCFSRGWLCGIPQTAAHQAPLSLSLACSPGKNTGVCCHFLFQCMKVKVKVKSYPTPSDPMDCSPPGSSIHGTLEARVLEWGAIAFSDLLVIKLQKIFFVPLF